jgi:pimeloyl-ACP methyl ester carboxylesterase
MAATREATILRLDGGRELAFREIGDPDGTPVFAFHGTPGSYRLFDLLDAEARRLGYRVIAPDRPGYGSSDYVPGRRLIDWPRDVTAIADFLGIAKFGVLGVSGGGPHAAVCAHQLAPRLLGAAIVCGIAETLTPADSEGMMPTNRLFSNLARRSQLLVWPLFALLLAGMRFAGPTLLRSMSKALPEPDRRVLALPEMQRAFLEEGRRLPRTAARATAQDFAIFTRPWGFRLEDIAMPVDVFCGGLDVNVPVAHGRKQADRIPDAKLHYYADEGHLFMFTRAEEVLHAASGRARGIPR